MARTRTGTTTPASRMAAYRARMRAGDALMLPVHHALAPFLGIV